MPQPLASGSIGPTLRLVPAAGGSIKPSFEDDEKLLEEFQAGRPGAGAQLYDRLFPIVDATLFRVLGRREPDHPDLVQSVFEQIVSTILKRRFARGCSLAGWAAVLACNVGFNALRARRRERGVVDREQDAATAAPAVDTQGDRLERQIGARDELAAVRVCLAEMDADRVTALLMHASGYDLTEIAALTRTSVAAAQSRLSRGRRELHARMDRRDP
jgi:RNA polymerase sigma-70 factor (ECF subfamily)